MINTRGANFHHHDIIDGRNLGICGKNCSLLELEHKDGATTDRAARRTDN